VNNFIEYLNINQGAAIVFLTFIYVIATLFIVFASFHQARLTRRSLDSFRESERNRYRPYVFLDITYDKTAVFGVLRNTGISPALDVQVSVHPALILQWSPGTEIGFVKEGMSFLAPGRELAEPFNDRQGFEELYPNLVFRGTIKYKDTSGSVYQEDFYIDMHYFKNSIYISEVEVGDELKRIAHTLQNFQKESFRPLVRVINEAEYKEEQKRLRDKGNEDEPIG
jgi:hypothetical protein